MPDYGRGKAAARGHALATNIQRQSSAPFQTVSRLKTRDRRFDADQAGL
jgi:hypothetical protein